MTYERSCGAVLFTRIDNVLKYVFVLQNNNEYSFPKGHMEPGETEMETAVREVFEEVGIRPHFIDGFITTELAPIPNVSDIVFHRTYFLAEYENQKIVYQYGELIDAFLVTYEEAMEMLPVESTKRVLTEANEFLKRLQ